MDYFLAGYAAVAGCVEETGRGDAVVSGRALIQANEMVVGTFEAGDCFGEVGFNSDAKRTSTITAEESVAVLSVSATLLEQVSSECQLRFNKVFLRSMILRLQGD